jgi:hypothetical protein
MGIGTATSECHLGVKESMMCAIKKNEDTIRGSNEASVPSHTETFCICHYDSSLAKMKHQNGCHSVVPWTARRPAGVKTVSEVPQPTLPVLLSLTLPLNIHTTLVMHICIAKYSICPAPPLHACSHSTRESSQHSRNITFTKPAAVPKDARKDTD